MDSEEVLERRYRLLLNAFPLPEQDARGEEMLGILLCSARPGQTRPTAAETLDLLGAAARSRTRCLLVADPVARLGTLLAVVLLVVAAGLTTVMLERRGLFTSASTQAEGPVLLDRFPAWDPTPAKVQDSPLGPAVMAYVDGHEDNEEFIVVLAADGHAARRIPLPGDLRGRWPFLLAPDGARLAQFDGSSTTVHDLRTGGVSRLSEVAPGAAGAPLAWSADGVRLAVASHGSTAVVDLGKGSVQRLPGTADSAAFAGDGRLAVSVDGRLEVYSAAGRRLAGARSTEHIAPAGWSPDGRSLVLTAHDRYDYDAGSHTPRDVTRTRPRGGLPELLTLRGNSHPLAWQGDGLLLEDAGSLVSWNPHTRASHVVVTRMTSDWYKSDIRVATTLAATASVTSRDSLDRGPVGPTRSLLALGLMACGFIYGWHRPPSYGRLVIRTTRDALAEFRMHAGFSIGANLAAFPIYWLATYAHGLETDLLNALTILLGLAGLVLGRSLGRARDIPDPRIVRSTAVLHPGSS